MWSLLWLAVLLGRGADCESSFYIATNHLKQDCLYYYSTLSIIPIKAAYCIRLIDNTHYRTTDFFNTRDQNYTFHELRDMNVTAYDIFLWSSSTDLSELYQDYINQGSESLLSNDLFFNCSPPWFGSRCEYSFEINEIKPSLYFEPSALSMDHTCYTLLECDRVGSFICLDWREICDGRIDCLNNGVDEAQCFDLEMNECKIDEYRCHIGLCIPERYWKYEGSTLECLDQSDSWSDVSCSDRDSVFDAFYCEEITCPPGPKKFPCGDGQCVEDFDACNNGRHLMLLKSLSRQGNLSYQCWIAMICLTKIIDQVHGTSCEEFRRSINIFDYLHSCDELIQFPIDPVLFGHVYFLYSSNETLKADADFTLTPTYVCYDERLCPFLSSTLLYKSHTCQHAHQMGLKSKVEFRSWKAVIDSVKVYFQGCNTRYDIKPDFKHLSLYLCKNSSKHISNHRILDNIVDCPLGDDEQEFELSCLLDDFHRFKCPNEVQCRSPIRQRYGCPSVEIEPRNIDGISYNQLCDGTTDILLRMTNGQIHTDETNCEHWPCSNIYTRCDGFWSCPYGEDEEVCQKHSCPPRFLDCISPYNYSTICLPAHQVKNGIIDCLGGLDELQLCQTADYYTGVSYRFRCLNNITCVDPFTFCYFSGDYLSDSEEAFDQDVCEEWILYGLSEIKNILCNITSSLKRYGFKLGTSQIYPPIEKQMIDHIIDLPVESVNDASNIRSQPQNFKFISHCTRGLAVYRWLGNANYSLTCFCPPNYYGHLCQYQNQRVSLTLTLVKISRYHIYAIFVKLIDDDNDRQEIHSYDLRTYVSRSTCRESFNMYLLYSTRPKNLSKNYSIHVDIYDQTTLLYFASWYFKVPFHFLPVNRLAVVLTLATDETLTSSLCAFKCHQGTCTKYINENKFFCRCNADWSGAQCHIPISCNNCSSNSLCVGNIHNQSICLCPSETFGTRCLLKHACPENYCNSNGQCIVMIERVIDYSYICLCSDNFGGNRCEYSKKKLQISFDSTQLSSYLISYIYPSIFFEPPITRPPILMKLAKMQHVVTFYLQYSFQMVFIKIDGSYYLAVLQQVQTSNISTSIDSTRRCPSFNELLDFDQLQLVRIERVKLYHMLCRNHRNLKCFFDEIYMCLCTNEQYANCFLFNHTENFQCSENVHCQNGGTCLQDHPTCPVTTICDCVDCFFGERCKFYAKGIGLTLDDILRYTIRSNLALNHQSILIKVSIVFVMVLFFMSLINSVLSFLTFRQQNSRKVGCGIYLYTSSITSFLTVTMLLIKFWFVLLTQMNSSTSRFVLRFGCLSIEPILKLFLWMNNWLNACVFIERSINVSQGIYFNKSTSKYIARRVVIVMPILIIGSNIYECLSRDLFEDHEEQRMWCVTLYSPTLYRYATAISFFHLLIPFFINLSSPIFTIYIIARQRALTRTCKSHLQHFKEQLHQYKHLIIGPIVLITLACPLFVISLFFRCVKTSQSSWLYLSSYFISFIPSTLLFVIHVLPSPLYKKAFLKSFKICRQLRRSH